MSTLAGPSKPAHANQEGWFPKDGMNIHTISFAREPSVSWFVSALVEMAPPPMLIPPDAPQGHRHASKAHSSGNSHQSSGEADIQTCKVSLVSTLPHMLFMFSQS